MLKSGWKTTEFWVTVLLMASTLAGWIAERLDGDAALIVAAVASGMYATSRGLAKKGAGDAQLRDQVLRAVGAGGDERVRATFSADRGDPGGSGAIG